MESVGTSYEQIYAVVRRIPRGRVATYGQVAALAGLGGHARQVGYALHALTTEGAVPWHPPVTPTHAFSDVAAPGTLPASVAGSCHCRPAPSRE